jgi:purine-binding chemotaxis protein CheW
MAENSPLVDQKIAVSMFLDSLMREPEPESEPSAPEAETVAPFAEAPPTPVITTPVLRPADIVVELTPPIQEEISPPIEGRTESIEEVQVESVQEADAVEIEETVPVSAGQPEWANQPFQAMLFKVAGLSLAVPLVELNGVVEWNEDNVTEMPGHAAFYMGLMTHLDKSIPVIDTARLVLPAEKLHQLAGDEPRERVTRVVLIDDHRWGLACDEVNEVVTLQPDQVRWRTSRTKRAWLAGTVVDHMCALIDGPAFSAMLKDGSHQRK